jgi:hypothetical protein
MEDVTQLKNEKASRGSPSPIFRMMTVDPA